MQSAMDTLRTKFGWRADLPPLFRIKSWEAVGGDAFVKELSDAVWAAIRSVDVVYLKCAPARLEHEHARARATSSLRLTPERGAWRAGASAESCRGGAAPRSSQITGASPQSSFGWSRRARLLPVSAAPPPPRRRPAPPPQVLAPFLRLLRFLPMAINLFKLVVGASLGAHRDRRGVHAGQWDTLGIELKRGPKGSSSIIFKASPAATPRGSRDLRRRARPAAPPRRAAPASLPPPLTPRRRACVAGQAAGQRTAKYYVLPKRDEAAADDIGQDTHCFVLAIVDNSVYKHLVDSLAALRPVKESMNALLGARGHVVYEAKGEEVRISSSSSACSPVASTVAVASSSRPGRGGGDRGGGEGRRRRRRWRRRGGGGGGDEGDAGSGVGGDGGGVEGGAAKATKARKGWQSAATAMEVARKEAEERRALAEAEAAAQLEQPANFEALADVLEEASVAVLAEKEGDLLAKLRERRGEAPLLGWRTTLELIKQYGLSWQTFGDDVDPSVTDPSVWAAPEYEPTVRDGVFEATIVVTRAWRAEGLRLGSRAARADGVGLRGGRAVGREPGRPQEEGGEGEKEGAKGLGLSEEWEEARKAAAAEKTALDQFCKSYEQRKEDEAAAAKAAAAEATKLKAKAEEASARAEGWAASDAAYWAAWRAYAEAAKGGRGVGEGAGWEAEAATATAAAASEKEQAALAESSAAKQASDAAEAEAAEAGGAGRCGGGSRGGGGGGGDGAGGDRGRRLVEARASSGHGGVRGDDAGESEGGASGAEGAKEGARAGCAERSGWIGLCRLGVAAASPPRRAVVVFCRRLRPHSPLRRPARAARLCAQGGGRARPPASIDVANKLQIIAAGGDNRLVDLFDGASPLADAAAKRKLYLDQSSGSTLAAVRDALLGLGVVPVGVTSQGSKKVHGHFSDQLSELRRGQFGGYDDPIYFSFSPEVSFELAVDGSRRR